MKRWLAMISNFFFPGAGYLLVGPSPRRRAIGGAWLVAMIGLTYVELSLQTAVPALYGPMFASVFLFNTALAIDTFFELAPEKLKVAVAA
jgi:hypothetical protein